jgi:hypothetical protein
MNLIKSSAAVVVAASFVVGYAPSARAQSTTLPPDPAFSTVQQPERTSYFDQRIAAPRQAFEITVGTGYTQGLGMFQAGVDMDRVATPGLGVDLGLGYRIDPRWAISVNGQYQELTAERAVGARGMTGNLAGTYHFSPYTRTDPWLSLATGYRMFWERNAGAAPNVLTHGFQLAKLSAGLDFRVDKDIALAPMIGADVNMFLWQDVTGNVALADPRVNTFVYAGLQARFDMTSKHETESGITTATR